MVRAAAATAAAAAAGQAAARPEPEDGGEEREEHRDAGDAEELVQLGVLVRLELARCGGGAGSLPLRERLERGERADRAAAKEVERIDAERKTYLKRHYGIDWSRSDQYDLVVNTKHLGTNGAAEVIVESAKKLPFG